MPWNERRVVDHADMWCARRGRKVNIECLATHFFGLLLFASSPTQTPCGCPLNSLSRTDVSWLRVVGLYLLEYARFGPLIASRTRYLFAQTLVEFYAIATDFALKVSIFWSLRYHVSVLWWVPLFQQRNWNCLPYTMLTLRSCVDCSRRVHLLSDIQPQRCPCRLSSSPTDTLGPPLLPPESSTDKYTNSRKAFTEAKKDFISKSKLIAVRVAGISHRWTLFDWLICDASAFTLM